MAVRWETCHVLTSSSHGWVDLEILILDSSLLPLPLSCQLFWERILFPPWKNPFPSISLCRRVGWARSTQWGWWLSTVVQSSDLKCWASEQRYTKPSWCVDATHSCFTWPTLKKKMQPLWAMKMSESNCEGGWTSYHKIKANEKMSHKFLKLSVKTRSGAWAKLSLKQCCMSRGHWNPLASCCFHLVLRARTLVKINHTWISQER